MSQNKLNIQQLSEEDRPREKLLKSGLDSMTNSELIAIIIGSGNTDQNAVELSQEILSKADNKLSKLAKYTIEELTDFKGIGKAKAISIMAALELSNRRLQEPNEQIKVLIGSNDIYTYLIPKFKGKQHEIVWAVFLNASNKIIKTEEMSKGGYTGSFLDPKMVLRSAVLCNAIQVAIAHNHPSGSTTPSSVDKRTTQRLLVALESLDIKLIDHIIVTDTDYFSFYDNGLIS